MSHSSGRGRGRERGPGGSWAQEGPGGAGAGAGAGYRRGPGTGGGQVPAGAGRGGRRNVRVAPERRHAYVPDEKTQPRRERLTAETIARIEAVAVLVSMPMPHSTRPPVSTST
jgi:hypothetical protein